MWTRLRRERAERHSNPLLNQPVEVTEVAALAFCFCLRFLTEPRTVCGSGPRSDAKLASRP